MEVLDPQIWSNIPNDVLMRHILSALPIDTRMALRLKPNRISKSRLEAYEGYITKIQRPEIFVSLDDNKQFRKITYSLKIKQKIYICEVCGHSDLEQLYIIEQEIGGSFFHVFIIRVLQRTRVIHRSHILHN